MKTSENPTSADNQQERSKTYQRGYLAGLIDGEGCFHIAFAIRKDLPIKILPIPEFHLSQHKDSVYVLSLAQKFFGCGYIKKNHNHSNDETMVFVVKDKHSLLTKLIPFFNYNPLYTNKKYDFLIFAKIVNLMHNGKHRSISGLTQIIHLAYSMNRGGKRRQRSKDELIQILKSSTTI